MSVPWPILFSRKLLSPTSQETYSRQRPARQLSSYLQSVSHIQHWTCCKMLTYWVITLFPMVFTILTSLPTASITLLKQPYCISTITGSMPLDHRSCHVFASAAVDTTDCNMLITCLHLDWEFTPAAKLVEVLPIMPSNMTKWDIMFLQPAKPDYLHNLISVQSICKTRSSSVVTPDVSSSLQVTNRSFTYASPYLWNQLPSSFRQPHSVHSPQGSPVPGQNSVTPL